MRSINFVEHLPDVIPPLMEVTELDADELSMKVLAEFGARTSNAGKRSTASASFTHGIPDASGAYVGDLEQLDELANFGKAFVFGGGYIERKRSALESSLAAMVRISERDFTDTRRRTKRLIGEKTLWLTRQAVGLSLTTGPARYSHGYAFIEERNPDRQIQSHGEGYEALLPYMTKEQRQIIKPKLDSVTRA